MSAISSAQKDLHNTQDYIIRSLLHAIFWSDILKKNFFLAF